MTEEEFLEQMDLDLIMNLWIRNDWIITFVSWLFNRDAGLFYNFIGVDCDRF